MSELLAAIHEAILGTSNRGADAFLLVVKEHGVSLPRLFDERELREWRAEDISAERYPLAGILVAIQRACPEAKIGMLVRGCDHRALVELSKYNQVDLERIVLVGLSCDRELAAACSCRQPYPEGVDPVVGERGESEENDAWVSELELMDEEGRLRYWEEEFEKCIKCYGCRNICPLCFCKECVLENPGLVIPGRVPPTFPSFHLLRAIDMAGRCVECGLCEEACPAHIPLRSLYRVLNRLVEDRFGYRPGVSLVERNPFTFLGGEDGLEKAG
jgi:ferredoxin